MMDVNVSSDKYISGGVDWENLIYLNETAPENVLKKEDSDW